MFFIPKSRRAAYYFLSTIVLLLVTPIAGISEEQTLDFHAIVDIQKDGSVLVTETITIHAEGDKFKSGITRPLPTRLYATEIDRSRRVKSKILSAKADNKELRYTTRLFNSESLRFRFRSQEGPLKVPGDHQFEIRYKVGRWIDHLQNENRLQWNLVGTLHSTPVKKARLMIRFPRPVEPEKIKTSVQIVGPYRGRPAGRDECRQFTDVEGNLCFETLSPLAGNRSLKVDIGFPPGMVDSPSEKTLRRESWQANLTARIAMAGMIAIALYYALTWWLTRRSCRVMADSIKEENEVPRDREGHPYSPAAIRFLRQQEFDNRCFAATLMNLVAGRMMQMDSTPDGTLLLQRCDEEPLPPLGLEEILVCETLFLNDDGETENDRMLDGGQLMNGKFVLQGAVESLNFDNCFFVEKRGCFDFGTVLCLLSFLSVPLAEMLYVPEAFALLFVSPFLFAGASGLAFVADRHFREWREKTGDDRFAVAFALTMFFLLGIVITVSYAWLLTWWAIPMLLEIVFFIGFFQYRLKYPTKEGMIVLERIEGFRRFLKRSIETAAAIPPRLRPYAFALNLIEEPELLKKVNAMLAAD